MASPSEPGAPSSILVPVDFSDDSRRAALYAATLAARVGARVELLHVWGDAEVQRELHDWWGSLSEEERFRESLASYISSSREGPLNALAVEVRRRGVSHVDVRLVQGDPAQRILEHAASSDLVVMGARGRAGLVERFVGSFTERIARRCPVPVLLVPAVEKAA